MNIYGNLFFMVFLEKVEMKFLFKFGKRIRKLLLFLFYFNFKLNLEERGKVRRLF